jgi:hypothetical protein
VLAKGSSNRNPEHERKHRAPSRQDADDNLAMPTAQFGICKFCHRLFNGVGGELTRTKPRDPSVRPRGMRAG